MKNRDPSKGKSIRKLFTNHGYELVLVDEYNTSGTSHENGEHATTYKSVLYKKLIFTYI